MATVRLTTTSAKIRQVAQKRSARMRTHFQHTRYVRVASNFKYRAH